LEKGRDLTPEEVTELRRNARKADSYERLARVQSNIAKKNGAPDHSLAQYLADQAYAIRNHLDTTPKVEEEAAEGQTGNKPLR